MFQVPLVTIFASFCFSAFSTPWYQLQLWSSTYPGVGSVQLKFSQQILLIGNATILGVFDWWWNFKDVWNFHPENWGRWTHFGEHIFQMGASTTNQFLIKLSCAHSLEAICIAGPADNSAVLEGEALGFFVFFCVYFFFKSQSATKTKVETNFAAHVEGYRGPPQPFPIWRDLTL